MNSLTYLLLLIIDDQFSFKKFKYCHGYTVNDLTKADTETVTKRSKLFWNILTTKINQNHMIVLKAIVL